MRSALLIALFFLYLLPVRGQVTCAVVRNTSCAGYNGILFATVSGGTSPYSYSIDNGITYQNSGYFGGLTAGIYTVTVKDALGVITTGSATIVNTTSPPSISVSYITPSCTAANGTITAVGSGGSPPYEYSLDGLHYQSSGTFTNIAGGAYVIIVRDVNGCTASDHRFVLANCPSIGVGVTEASSVSCSTMGAITLTKDPGNNNSYTYSIDGVNFQSTPQFTGLDVGVYNISIKDATGAIVSVEGVTVLPSCGFTINSSTVNATCATSTGSITATAFGAVSPYQYSLDNITYQSSGSFPNLPPSNYTVIAKDANGEITSTLVPVYSTCIGLNINVDKHTTCGNNNGQLTATVTNGIPPYRYSIDGINFQSSNVFSSLTAGNYTVTVKDLYGNTATAVATINPSINDLTFTVTIQPATCLLNDGGFTINATGGLPPYQYSTIGVNYQPSNVISGLRYGQYPARVIDANGCLFFTYPVIIPFVCLNVTATATDATCGNSNGQIVANAGNGITPYQYSINGIDFQSSPIFSGLPPSSYTITAKDANNSIATTQVIINNSCININAATNSSTCSKANGSMQINATNGTAPYTYSIDGVNFQPGNMFTRLSANTYTVNVKDANGLTGSALITITDIPGPQLTATTTAATCSDNDGTITALASGGTAPLQYSITGTIFQNNNYFANTGSGKHTILVKDANGCTSSYIITIPLTNDLALTPGNDITICEGNRLPLSINSNGDSYLWSPTISLNNSALKNPIASPTVTTVYTVTAKKGACSQTASISVYVNPAPVAEAGQGSIICFGQNSQLSGSGGITYSWTPSIYLSDATIPNPVVIKPATTTTYSLSVTDANNCKSLQASQVTISVTPPAQLFAGNDTSVAINQPMQLLAKDVNNSGFTQYTWSPDYGLNNPHVPNPTTILDRDITYEVTATTSAGCQGIDQITVKVYKGPDIYVPNAFTPNGDGHNDVLKPIPIGLRELRSFIIYNRWGQLVFRSSNASLGWDGKENGILQSANSYVWIAEGLDYNGKSIIRKGTVILIL